MCSESIRVRRCYGIGFSSLFRCRRPPGGRCFVKFTPTSGERDLERELESMVRVAGGMRGSRARKHR